MPALDYDAYDVLTFDCYGTLIDWEAGLLEALHRALGTALDGLSDDELLARFSALEHAAQSDGARYRDVLIRCLLGIGAELGVPIDHGQAETFGGSVVDWPAFADSGEALALLHSRFALVAITNCDDDLFAASEQRLGVSFDLVVTAEQVGRYKPDLAGFHVAHERIERELVVPRTRILHVAQSIFHDHVPAKSLGMSSVWIDRRDGRAGGATPAADAEPDARFTTMRAFAAAAVPGGGNARSAALP